MKYLIYILGFGLLAIGSACDTSELSCTRASSNIISVERDHKDFRGVVFNEVGDIVLTQAPEYAVKLTGPDNVIELTESFVDGEILIIGGDNCYNGDYGFKIEISAPEIQYIALAGVGRIQTTGTLESDVIQVEVFGIGDVEADFKVDTLYTTVSGTVNFVYGGEAYYHQINSTGDYDLDAYALETQNTSITFSGRGENYVTVHENLVVKIIGSGNVYYKGIPTIDSDISGSGQIIDSN